MEWNGVGVGIFEMSSNQMNICLFGQFKNVGFCRCFFVLRGAFENGFKHRRTPNSFVVKIIFVSNGVLIFCLKPILRLV